MEVKMPFLPAIVVPDYHCSDQLAFGSTQGRIFDMVNDGKLGFYSSIHAGIMALAQRAMLDIARQTTRSRK
jgi:hypothetical protein